jgi:2-polyprenyl-6-methoxyphenol hydroxylase-like FAD-dependent oxidoreductase
MHSDVLVVGAGPTGLVLALWLAKLGVKVHIVDKTAEPGTTSRAVAVQARTLELYRQLDLTDAVVDRGHKVPAVNLWVKGEQAARIRFENVGSSLTPYPFLQIFPQDAHERLLVDRLQQLGVTVARNTELIGFTDRADCVTARLRGPDGTESEWQTCYIAGCDGAKSRIRDALGTGFPGGTYRQVFYVADVEATGPAINGELHIDLDEADFLGIFPLSNQGRARLIGTVRDERAEHAESLKFEDVSDRAIEHLKVRVDKVNWFSTYHVHHRVTEHFRIGRAFLLGDAAHIHSPAGGQGMNTGIGDAINLAWKLAAVLTGKAPDALLDSYEAERIGFARRLVSTTDRVFSFATTEGPVASVVRTRLAPAIIPMFLHFTASRDLIFRLVSQIRLHYRGCPLSVGMAGRIHGGDRLPWLGAEVNNFASLADPRWQVHVYGTATPALTDWCAQHDLPLHVFAWQPRFESAGFAQNALYLLRPDTYVAFADTSATPESLEQYFRSRGMRFSGK